MTYCKICGIDVDDANRSKQYPRVCQECVDAGYVKHCAHCNCFIGDNGNGYLFYVTQAELNRISQSKVIHTVKMIDYYALDGYDHDMIAERGLDDDVVAIVTVWLCDFHYDRIFGRNHYNIDALVALGGNMATHRIEKALRQSLSGSLIESDDGDLVEPDSDKSILHELL